MTTVNEIPTPRLRTRYREEIKPALREQFDYANVMQIPGVVRSWSTWAWARRPATPS